MLCPWQQRTKIDAPGFSPVLLPRSSYLQKVPAFWGFFYNIPWVSSGWKRTHYQLILEVLATDVLLAKPNQIICFLGRFLCTFVQGMNGKMMGWAGQGSAGTEGQGSRCFLRSRGAARQQEQPAVTQNPPGPPLVHVAQAPSPNPADKLPCTLVLPALAFPSGIRRVNPAFPGPERAGTILEQG